MRPLDLAKRWHHEGLLSDEAFAKLQARYPEGDVSAMATVLFAGAGAVLAAAIIAVPFLADVNIDATRIYLLAMGSVATGVGFAVWRLTAWQDGAEGLAVTAGCLLVPAALMFLFDEPETWIVAMLVGGLGAVAVGLPARTAIVATVGAASLHITWVATMQHQFSDEVATTSWLILSAAFVVLAFFIPKQWNERHAILQVTAPVVLGIATVTWWAELVDGRIDLPATGELTVALVQLPVLLGAFVRQHRPLLIGSVGVLAVDAIVFGFDIGQLALGIPMLLLVAGGLVWLAIWSRD